MQLVQRYDPKTDLIKTEWELSRWDKVIRWLISCMPKQLKLGAKAIGRRCTSWLSENPALTRLPSTKVPAPVVSRKRCRVPNSAVSSKTSIAKQTGKLLISKPATAHRPQLGTTKSNSTGTDAKRAMAYDAWRDANKDLPLDQLDETDSVLAVAFVKARRNVDGNG